MTSMVGKQPYISVMKYGELGETIRIMESSNDSVSSVKCGVTHQGIDSLPLCPVVSFYGSEGCPGLLTGVNEVPAPGLGQQADNYS